MASGMSPCWTDVVQEELLEQLCPEELQAFNNALCEADISGYEFHQAWRSGEDSLSERKNEDTAGSQGNDPNRALQILIETFRVKTRGLELDICFHDPENGDRYDEVSGLFFTVSGVFQYTSAGEKFKQFIERKGWVEFG